MGSLFRSFLALPQGGYRRSSGVLIHITSLPGGHGIGDIGRSARTFVDFLAQAGQGYWQFLPLGPTSSAFDHSPYMALSALAGNPLLIDLWDLADDGLLDPARLRSGPEFSPYLVEFPRVAEFKSALLREAFAAFMEGGGREELERFRRDHPWARDYALFMALRAAMGEKGILRWPLEIRLRRSQALDRWGQELDREVSFHLFTQWAFDRQWHRLRRHARERGVRLIGDIPIYVGLDSADVWSHPGCFLLDPTTLRPRAVAGVPPDYFSSKGQLWGNPLYRWRLEGRANPELYRWWEERVRRTSALVDVVRIDHFRGFEAYWRVPAGAKDARGGRWCKGPGLGFFRRLRDSFSGVGVLAEDLGTITPAVERLRDRLGFPGMKVLQFAFDSGPDNPYLPHNYTSPNCVVYTGTHDNDTCVGWYLDPAVDQGAKAAFRRYANSDGSSAHLDFIRLAYGSVAALAVVPMQDILGFGSDCRMNRPSVAQGNWVWRLAPHYLNRETADFLRDLARFYNRAPC